MPRAHRPTLARTLHGLTLDLRYALRSVARSPGFAASALLTIALGVGSTTAIFSIVDGVLLRPLPYTQSERASAPASASTARSSDRPCRNHRGG
jgi:hypothetical protein